MRRWYSSSKGYDGGWKSRISSRNSAALSVVRPADAMRRAAANQDRFEVGRREGVAALGKERRVLLGTPLTLQVHGHEVGPAGHQEPRRRPCDSARAVSRNRAFAPSCPATASSPTRLVMNVSKPPLASSISRFFSRVSAS